MHGGRCGERRHTIDVLFVDVVGSSGGGPQPSRRGSLLVIPCGCAFATNYSIIMGGVCPAYNINATLVSMMPRSLDHLGTNTE